MKKGNKKMKNTTIQKIIEAATRNQTVTIGAYTYKADLNTGEISRCLTSDVGRVWIDSNGNRTTNWKVVAHA
jgi:hypothetical protein